MTQEEIMTHCPLTSETRNILEHAVKKLRLTARTFFKIIKVSRTIADLAESPDITRSHVLEALSYKSLQQNYDL